MIGYSALLVSHDSGKELHAAVESLRQSTLPPSRILIVENGRGPMPSAPPLVDDGGAIPIEIIRGPEDGEFASGVNAGISRLRSRRPNLKEESDESEWILLINPDIRVEPGYAEAVLREAAARGAALATGMILRPGGRLDSLGHILLSDRTAVGWGEGRRPENVSLPGESLGVPLSAAFVSPRLLDRFEGLGEPLLDELLGTFLDDIDLGIRVRRLGLKSLVVRESRAVHDRGHSYRDRPMWRVRLRLMRNRYLLLAIHDTPLGFIRDLPSILLGEAALWLRNILTPWVPPLALASAVIRLPKALERRRRRSPSGLPIGSRRRFSRIFLNRSLSRGAVP